MHIQFPSSDSTFEIKAELYKRLLDAGFIVRGEVKIKSTPTNPGCCFDLIIYDEDKKAIAIIEYRKYKSKFHPSRLMKKETMKKYQQFGLPIFMIEKLSEVDKLVDYIIEWFEQPIT